MEDIINLYLGSSCKNNGTSNAKAAIGICIDDDISNPILQVIEDPAITNQRADLIAIREAINNSKGRKVVNIYSRSEYAVNSTTTWIEKWKTNNWQNVSKKSIKNLALIQEIVDKIKILHNEGILINIIFLNKNSQNDAIMNAQYAASSLLSTF